MQHITNGDLQIYQVSSKLDAKSEWSQTRVVRILCQKNWKFCTPFLWILITLSKQDTVYVWLCPHCRCKSPVVTADALFFLLSFTKICNGYSSFKKHHRLKTLIQCAAWFQFELEHFCLEIWHQIKKLYPFSVFHPNKPCTQLAGQPQTRSQKGCRAETLQQHSVHNVIACITTGPRPADTWERPPAPIHNTVSSHKKNLQKSSLMHRVSETTTSKAKCLIKRRDGN